MLKLHYLILIWNMAAVLGNTRYSNLKSQNFFWRFECNLAVEIGLKIRSNSLLNTHLYIYRTMRLKTEINRIKKFSVNS